MPSLSEYKLESKSSTGSVLPLYISSLPTLPPQSISPSPIDSPPSYNNNMSHIDFQAIIHQQQEQLAAMQVQIQALLAGREGEAERTREVGRGGGVEVAKLQIFDRTVARVAGFIIACKLYMSYPKLRNMSETCLTSI